MPQITTTRRDLHSDTTPTCSSQHYSKFVVVVYGQPQLPLVHNSIRGSHVSWFIPL